jgi:hypothetical protein
MTGKIEQVDLITSVHRRRRSRFVEQPHMGVAGCKKTLRGWENQHFLYGDPQPRNGLFDQIRAPAHLSGLSRNALPACSITRSLGPAHSIGMPLM